jgi:hypothetical protein
LLLDSAFGGKGEQGLAMRRTVRRGANRESSIG